MPKLYIVAGCNGAGKQRVANGGHHIEDDVVNRDILEEFKISLSYMLQLAIIGCWLITSSEPVMIANGNESKINIAEALLWKKIHDLI